MAHDNYDKFYTWDKGTLILDPGVFAWDEPHLKVCDQAIPFANALDKIADQKFSKACDYPARLLSTKHSNAPANVLEKCETVSPGRSYCCPPYAMPPNWRMDYLTMDANPDSLGQVEDNDPQAMSPEILEYYEMARKFGQEVEGEISPIVQTISEEAGDAYRLLEKELALLEEDFVPPPIVNGTSEIVPQVVKTADEAIETARAPVRRWPLVSLGLGIAAGLIVGKMIAR